MWHWEMRLGSEEGKARYLRSAQGNRYISGEDIYSCFLLEMSDDVIILLF